MRSSSNPVLFIVGGIFLLVGIPFIIVAFFSYQSTSNFMRGAITTTGTITHCNWTTSTTTTRDSNGNTHTTTTTMCQPTIRFHTQEERQVEFVSDYSGGSMHEGQEVQVSYHPEQPEKARISSFGGLWLLPLIFGGLGSVFTIVALFLLSPLLLLLFFRPSPASSYATSTYTDSPYSNYSSTASPYATDPSSSSFYNNNSNETFNEDEADEDENEDEEDEANFEDEEMFPSDKKNRSRTSNRDTF